ncbi:CidA/LrgA family protein [Aneurinibacillus sp. Ricciae_BoGa-3]|uniref:CidA/LrgA family protein n=1 Tax=Aneurinibacillus sp. Ricciae_BoGa-3 TaxID=3022697 RepID=UPI0023407CD1|nr:CidA/LrgA family protein [Aneurinibacillus sp. Ricciae_BoGa-3]WCK53792.1 CidA/LrgA family protein [Aneurinibacillus sp. Ricciae_BoGa-3]
MKKIIKGISQIGILIIISFLGSMISNALHLAIPGSIIGMFILFGLLQTGVLKLNWVEMGAGWLLAELLLFFIPSAVGIIQYKQLMIEQGSKFLLVIAISTFVVMAATGLWAEFVSKYSKSDRTG